MNKKAIFQKGFFVFVVVLLMVSGFAIAKDFMVQNSSNSDQNYFVVNGTSGFTGIGTSGPAGLLDVTGSHGSVIVEPTGVVLKFTRPNSASYIQAAHDGIATSLEFVVGSTVATGTRKMIIKQNGNVGIGTTSPLERLDINGGGADTKLRISSGGNYAVGLKLNNSITEWMIQNLETIGRFRIWNTEAGEVLSILNGTSGNVGIGTVSPAYKLDVNGTINAESLLVNGVPVASSSDTYWENNSNDIYYNTGNVGIGTSSPSAKLDVIGNINWGTGGEGILGFDADSATIRGVGGKKLSLGANNAIDELVIDVGGNVGIGTDSPSARLTVNGGINLLDGTALIHSTVGGLRTAALNHVYNFIDTDNDGTGFFQIGKGNSSEAGSTYSALLTVLNTGNVGIGTSSPGDHLAIEGSGTQNISIYSTDTGVQNTPKTFLKFFGENTGGGKKEHATISSAPGTTASSAGQLIFSTMNSGSTVTERMRIDEGGNVGIGTVSPAYNLDVNGTINAESLLVNGVPVASSSDTYWENNSADIYYSAGNVGIGTSSPTSILQLDHNTHFLRMNEIDGTENKRMYGFVGEVDKLHLSARNDTGQLVRNIITYEHDGNVGIGTSSPGSLLHLNGEDPEIRFTDTGDLIWGIQALGASTTRRLAINDITNTNELFTVLQTGNVGIGTSSPGHRLDVRDIVNSDVVHFVGESGGFSNSSYAMFNSRAWFGYNGTLNVAEIKGGAGKDIHFSPGGVSSAMIVEHTTGNVGIGTSSPGAKLEVNGSILASDVGANEVKITVKNSAREWAFRNTATGDIVIRDITASLNRLLIDSSGNVGIGTSSPLAKLDVHESTVLGGTTGNNQLISEFSTPGGSTGNTMRHREWAYRDATGTAWTTWRLHDAISVDSSFATPGIDTKVWWERDPQHDIQSWGNAASTYMTINAGNVGIGTDSPTQLLHLKNIGAANIVLDNDADNTGARSNYVYFYNEGLQSAAIRSLRPTSGTNEDGQLAFLTSNSDEAMRILSNGNVGIGTSSPTTKLDIVQDADTEDSGIGIYNAAENAIGRIWMNGADMIFQRGGDNEQQLVLDATGNVGIGTSSPSAKLDVVGDVEVGGVLDYTSNSVFENATIPLSIYSTTNTLPYEKMIVMRNNNNQNVAGLRRMGISWQFSTESTSGESNKMAAITAEAEGVWSNDPSLNFWVEGAKRMTILDSGNVGIGTSSPGANLEVKPSASGGGIAVRESDDGNDAVRIEGYSSNGVIRIKNAGTDKIVLNGNGNSYVNINNFGVGTSSPDTKLEVEGNSGDTIMQVHSATGATGAYFRAKSDTTDFAAVLTQGSSGQDWRFGQIGNDDFTVRDQSNVLTPFIIENGTPSSTLYLDSTGNVGIGTVTPSQKLQVKGNILLEGDNVNAPMLILRTINNTGSSSQLRTDGVAGSEKLVFKVGGTDKVVIDRGGNVGIGTDSPYSKLEIRGAGQTVDAITDAGVRGDMISLLASSSSANSGGALLFGNAQSETNGSLGMAAIKGSLVNGGGTTTGDLLFLTRGLTSDTALTERMRILSSGNVGIGTGSPTLGKLQVKQSAETSTSGITVTDPSVTGAGYLWVDSSNVVRLDSLSTGNGDISLNGAGSGNVGIGTSSPSAKLDVEVSSGGAATIGSSLNSATGNYAVAMGYNANASGLSATAMGYATTASGDYSTAMGIQLTASGNYATAMGHYTTASGNYATAMGSNTDASASYSTAMGGFTDALGDYSTAMGYNTNALAIYSTAMGRGSTAAGETSTAMGYYANASGIYSTAIGYQTKASGQYSTAMGYRTTVSGYYSTAMGHSANASGHYSTSIGREIQAGANYVVAIGLADMNGVNCAQANSMCIMGGNVGIGDATPSYKLEVTGTLKATDYYSGDGTQGMTGNCDHSIVVKDGLIVSCS